MAGQHPRGAADGWRLSLIIPAYNEESNIRQAVEEADAALAGLTRDYEILVVDDGSSDGTAAEVLAAARRQPNVHLLRHPVNRGYGAALRTGFEAARMDLVAFTDADCQFDLADLALLLPLTKDYPVVTGYRMQRQDPWRRRFFSWGYNHLVRALLGTRVRDCDCALKVFRREALAELLPQSSGFLVNAEMLARAQQLHYRVAEVGVRHRPRLGGHSKVSLADIPRTLRALLPFWWSRVLFAGPDPDPSTSWTGLGAGLLLVLVAAVALFFCRLSCPLLEPQEARYAEIPRQMLAAGSWVVPVLHGEPYWDKPPLLYWLVMASYSLFGVHDWAARLVPGAAGVFTVLLTYLWGCRAVGPRAGLAGALVLCLSARYVYLGRMLTMDTLLCLWVVAALAAGQVAVQGPTLRRGWWWASAAAGALGLLTKGPVALVLVAVPLLAYQLLDPRTARPRPRAWLAYLALAMGLAAPWYVAVTLREPGFLHYFFWKHNVVRFAEAFDHQEPVWFYLPGLLLGMLPWTLLLPGLIRFLGRRPARAAARRPAALGFFLLASLWCLLFFSAAECKRALYILPAMPTLALALGCYLDAGLPRERFGAVGLVLWRRGSRLAHTATLGVLAVGIGGSLLAVGLGLWRPIIGIGLAGTAAVVLAAAARFGPRHRPVRSWAACGAVTFVLLLLAIHQLLPAYARRFSLRGHVRPHAELCADPAVVVACYPRRWDSVSFYLGRSDVRVYTADQRAALVADLRRRPGTLLFVKPGPALDELLRAMPEGLEYVPRGRQGTVRVGWVRSRWEAQPGLYASR
ncbi:MAG TPA: glycosyltransferase [Gemmataceae bacterium]|nr:glycosyltransferase [Gemmataceae bacterium]